jgi:hypothetical protein
VASKPLDSPHASSHFFPFVAEIAEIPLARLDGGIYPRSLRIALVVGTLLNLVNQPGALLGPAPLNLTQALLTYAVPFLVATYAAVAPGRDPSA